jgi:hypothetical protein
VAPEGGGEGADAAEADGEADLEHPHVGGAQQVARALHAAGEQVLVGGLAEGAPEAPAEVARRDVCRARERLQVERLGVPAVDQVAGAEQVARQRGRRRYEPSPSS